MAQYFSGKNLVKKRVGNVDGGILLKNKIVGLFFSANWCPGCRYLTPILKKFYQKLDKRNFEIVFISVDKKESDMLGYFSKEHGNWACLPFGKRELKSELMDKFNSIEGIPRLTILSPDGSVLEADASELVEEASEHPENLFAK